MFKHWLRTLLPGRNPSSATPNGTAPRLLLPAPPKLLKPSSSATAEPIVRHSNGLEQFFGSIQDQAGLALLDFSSANQANIGFITNLGHRVYSEDLLSSLDQFFPDGNQNDPERAQEFIDATFNFRDYDFDGALVWDSLQYLSPPILHGAIDRLYRTLRPQACLLAFFHADDRAPLVPAHSYRIAGPKTIQLTPRGMRKPGLSYNNRAIERLFHKFNSVKFFLTRDNLREVIVRR